MNTEKSKSDPDYNSDGERAKLRASLRRTLLMMEATGIPRDVLLIVIEEVLAEELLKEAHQVVPGGAVGAAVAELSPVLHRIHANNKTDPGPVLSAIATHLASILRSIGAVDRAYAEALMNATLEGVRLACTAKGGAVGAIITIAVHGDDDEEERKH